MIRGLAEDTFVVEGTLLRGVHPTGLDGMVTAQIEEWWKLAGLSLKSGPAADPLASIENGLWGAWDGNPAGSYVVQLPEGEGGELLEHVSRLEKFTGLSFSAGWPVTYDGGDLGKRARVFPVFFPSVGPVPVVGREAYRIGRNVTWSRRRWLACTPARTDSELREWQEALVPGFEEGTLVHRDLGFLSIGGVTRFVVHGPSGAPTLETVAYFWLGGNRPRP